MRGGIYGPYARLVRRAVRLGLRGWSAGEEAAPPEGAVFVARHQNLAGPVRAVALLDREVRVWVLSVFFSRKECFDQYYGYTFTRRFGWPRPLAFCAAGLLALAIPPLMRSLGAIPVYRGSARVRETLRQSAAALGRGESVLICPDENYTTKDGETGAIYRGFLHLERLAGGHVPFVPLCSARHARRFVVGPALYFPGLAPFKEEQEGVARALSAALDRMRRDYDAAP